MGTLPISINTLLVHFQTKHDVNINVHKILLYDCDLGLNSIDERFPVEKKTNKYTWLNHGIHAPNT